MGGDKIIKMKDLTLGCYLAREKSEVSGAASMKQLGMISCAIFSRVWQRRGYYEA